MFLHAFRCPPKARQSVWRDIRHTALNNSICWQQLFTYLWTSLILPCPKTFASFAPWRFRFFTVFSVSCFCFAGRQQSCPSCWSCLKTFAFLASLRFRFLTVIGKMRETHECMGPCPSPKLTQAVAFPLPFSKRWTIKNPSIFSRNNRISF